LDAEFGTHRVASHQWQAVAFRKNALGAWFVPLYAPLNPIPPWLPFAGIVAFHDALLSVAKLPRWLPLAFHALPLIVWLPGHAHVSCHPLIEALPVLLTEIAAVKPVPQSLLTE